MTDLVIVNPAAAHGLYGPLGEKFIAVEPPQWARILAGYVRDRGFTAAIVDAEAMGWDANATVKATAEKNPKLICIAVYGHQPSASTQQMWGAGLLAKALAYADIGPTIMVGGHPSALPVRTLKEEAVDYVAQGEGPVTILGLLRGDERAIVPGLVWRDGQTIRLNKPAELIENMDELHGNCWNLLPMERYRAHNWQCLDDLTQRQPYASIFTSLGCPYKCSFCCINAPFASNRYRMRRPESVVTEIQNLYMRHNVKVLKITDEMFVLNERHYKAICEGLAMSGLGGVLNIWAYARVDTVKPENLATLHRGGIRWLALGIESGSALVRDGANKKMRTEDIVGTVRAIQDAGINVIGNFMFGLKDDTKETMQQTLDLALECRVDWANFYSTMAYPGSALYAEAVQKGWALPTSWRGYSQHNDDCRPLDTDHVRGRDVLAFRDEAFERFFTDHEYLNHVAGKFGGLARQHIESMVGYKLKRKILEMA
jgi:radical SAM superfamily enzyme YgiQ (UPF0313 family)